MDNKNNIATLVFLISLGTLFYLAHRDMKIKKESISENYKSTIECDDSELMGPI